MKVPPNLLRSQVEDFEHTPNWLSTKLLERRTRILTTGRHLLVRDAPLLSETNYTAIQQSHDQHGIILAGKLDADIALTLLDAPRLDPLRIHAMLATLEGTGPALLLPLPMPAPAPEPKHAEIEPPCPLEPEIAPEFAPELEWSDDLETGLHDPFQPYNGQAPGAWVFNPNHARSPPHAAKG